MLKLFLIVIGGKPEGRNIEQHDVMFSVAENIEDTFDAVQRHWDTKVHIDSYMIVDEVDGYTVSISSEKNIPENEKKLIFINLGGYKENDLEEYHKKLVIAANSLSEAKSIFTQDSFYSEMDDLEGAPPHLDDKMELRGFDVDDSLVVDDEISPEYSIILTPDPQASFSNNKPVPGYIPL